MKNLFKNEACYYVAILILSEAKKRKTLLKANYSCYSSKKVAIAWKETTLTLIQDAKEEEGYNQAIEIIERMYIEMTC